MTSKHSCTGGLGCCNPHGDCPQCGCAGKIERLTRELKIQKAVVDLAYIPHRTLVESRDNVIAERDRLRNDLQELTCGDERYTRLGRQNERLRAALEQVHTQADQWLDNPLATGTRVIERIEKLAREALESSAPETEKDRG
jgi:cell division protein FtsL